MYTQQQYDHHLKQGDGDGSEGHPNCEFCRRRFYDKTALFTHLSKEHYSCHLCEKAGIKFKYFANYDSLEVHFRRSHHLCSDELCLSKKFVVFSTSIELGAHQRQYHNSYANQNRNIPIHFKIKRNISNNSIGHGDTDPDDDLTEDERRMIYNSSNNNSSNNNETKYDAGLAGRALNGEWQIELPAVREPVEMRDAMRTVLSSSSGPTSSGSMMVAQEEYPGLPGTNSSVHSMWTGGHSQQQKQQQQQQKKKSLEDFPMLESKPKATAPTNGGSAKSAQAQVPVPVSSLLGSSWGMPTKKDKRLSRPKPQQPSTKVESPAVMVENSNNIDSSSKSAILGIASSTGSEPVAQKKKASMPKNSNNIASINNIFKSLGLTNNNSNGNVSKKTGGLTVVKTNAVIQKSASGGNLAMTMSSGNFAPSEVAPSGPIKADIFSNLAFPPAKKSSGSAVQLSSSSSSSSIGPMYFSTNDLLPPPPGFIKDDPLHPPSLGAPVATSVGGPSIAESWVTVGGAQKSVRAMGGSAGVSLAEAAYPSLPPSTVVPGLPPGTPQAVAAGDSSAKKAEVAAKAKPSKKVKNDLQSLAFKKK